MSHFPLLSIHYDGETIRAEDGSVIFRSPNPIFAYLPNDMRCLSSLKNLILNVTGQQERSSSTNASNTQSTGMMIDLNITPEGSMHALNPTQDEVESHQIPTRSSDPTDESFFMDPVLSDEEIDPAVLSDQEAAAMNYFTGSSIAFTQPAISEKYDCPTHLSSLNLDSMNEQVSHVQRAPKDDPTTEFEVGQKFQNKEVVLMAVKTYSINRAVDYKILESDQLKYAARCIKQD
ncbi:hypothetical protein PIB30_051208 [Stylosanthes scabra]|uniref:Transposase MuDR plant domain-containing protein n=1 Tax=Stylosanthes scabra TaxID=79078 RepID=A0ABU6ZGK5_9FABA|nr:hypothetical protein [Stylosanthes scabra]